MLTANFFHNRLSLALKIALAGSLLVLAADLFAPSGAGLAGGLLGLLLYGVLLPVRPVQAQGLPLLLLALLAGLLPTLLLRGACAFWPGLAACPGPAFRAQAFLHFFFIPLAALGPWLLALLLRRGGPG